MNKLFLIHILFISLSIYSQESSFLKVYLDCGFCDMNYIREEIPFVDYVRDREDADLHILTSRQQTGSGGREFTFFLLGLNVYSGINDTIKIYKESGDSEDIERKNIVKGLKLALIPYVKSTSAAANLTIGYNKSDSTKIEINDSWDYWVFRVSLNGHLDGEESYNSLYLNSFISASRITEESKFWAWTRNNYNEDNFDLEGDKSKFVTRRQQVGFSYVYSLAEKWSLGTWLRSRSSTYDNIDLNVQLAPGVEYNFFPYSESSHHQFRVEYRLWFLYNNYNEETIYLKKDEKLMRQELSIVFGLLKPWGEIDLTLSGSSYFHDFSLNSFHLHGGVELNLTKGLSIDIGGGVSAIHDQIALRKSDVDIEELLLRRRELETQYNFYSYFGFSYSFGSIYNNVVNTRFGD